MGGSIVAVIPVQLLYRECFQIDVYCVVSARHNHDRQCFRLPYQADVVCNFVI